MCGFGWGHPIVPLLVSFAHIHAKYLIHFYFFFNVPDSSQNVSAHPEI